MEKSSKAVATMLWYRIAVLSDASEGTLDGYTRQR